MVYTISEVAKMLNISTPSLRRWERHGLIAKCERRPTGRREYTDEDIKAIKIFLVKRT